MNSIEKSKFCIAKSYMFSLGQLKFNRNKATGKSAGSSKSAKKARVGMKKCSGIGSEIQIQSVRTTKSKQSFDFEQSRGYVNRGSDRLDEWLMESTREYLRPPENSLISRISSTIVPQISQSKCYIRNSAVLGCLLLDRCYELNKTNKSGVAFTIDQIYENRREKSSKYTKENPRRKNLENAFIAESTKAPFQKLNHTEREAVCIDKSKENIPHHTTNADEQMNAKTDNVCQLNDAVPLSSYIECPSEILQRMTNLEVAGNETLSSITGTDVEVREDFSSNYIIEQDNSSLIEGQSEDWFRFENYTRENLGDIRNARIDKKPLQFCSSHIKHDKDLSDPHDYRHHYCWRREVTKQDGDRSHRDCRGRCRNCQKNKFNNFQVPRPFVPFPKRISVGRICRRRWNLMWKNTQERWAGKAKSQSKMKKLNTTSDLDRSVFWENADAQTAVLLYHEAGTDAVVKELKSAEITASPKLLSEDCDGTGSGNETAANEKFCSKPIVNIINSVKTYKNHISTSIESFNVHEVIRASKLQTNKGQDKATDLRNSNSIYKTKMVDQAIHTMGSLALISKTDNSSATLTTNTAMTVVLKGHDELIQTDEVISTETETYVNYNKSMEGYFNRSSSVNVSSEKPKETQVTPKPSRNETSEVMVSADVMEGSSADERRVEKDNNTSPAESEDTVLSRVSDTDSVVISTQSTVSDVAFMLGKDVSTEMTSKEINLDMDASRYLCCRQYETKSHGTYTGSSMHIPVQEKHTSAKNFARKSDVGVSASKLTSSFQGGPTSKFYITTGVSTGGLIVKKSFNGGSHYSQCSFATNVCPERATACTSTGHPVRSKSTGVGCGQRGRPQRPIAFLQNDSDSDVLWSLEGSLLDVLLRSCSSDVATQVKQVFASSRTNKKTNTKSSSVGVFTSLHADGKSFQTAFTMLESNEDVKDDFEPTTSTGVCTSRHLVEVSVQTMTRQLIIKGNHQSVSGNKEYMASVIPIYKKTVTVEKEFNKDKPKQELKQTQRSEAEPPQATSAPNELALECRNDRGKIVKPLTITKATSVRSFVKKCRSSSAITSRFIFPSATLRVNANHRCVQGTDCLFVYDPPRCFVHTIQKDASAQIVQPIISSKEPRRTDEKRLRSVGLLTSVQDMSGPYCSLRSDFIGEVMMPKGRFRDNNFGPRTHTGTQTSRKEWRNNGDKKTFSKGSYDRIYQNFSKHQFSSIKHKRLKAFRQRTPSTDDYRKRSLNISNVFQIEACTMKPSCYTNESCQTQNLMSLPAGKFDTSSTCILSPALSLTEICSGRDKSDLKTVYFMLSAIEGRIRRLKRNVRSQ